MKKIVYYIAVAFLAINFSSCSDFLDLPSKSKTDSESVFSSIDKAEMAVLACYTGVWMQDVGIRLRMEQMKCGLLRVIRMLIIMRPIMCSMIKVVPQAFILPLIPALSVVIHA